MTKIKWKCRYCGDIIISDTDEHHKMDFCKCHKSAVDAEKEYIRTMGKVEFLDKKLKSN